METETLAKRFDFIRAAKLFVSLPAAMITLTTMTMFSIYGTVWYEGQESMDFFAEPAFSVVSVTFMLQLVVAVLTRIPWKITHTGWIITHTGLIVICLGHMTTCQKGYTGQVGLFEGRATGYVSLETHFLTIDLPKQKQRVRVKLALSQLENYPDTEIAMGIASLPNGDTITVERFMPTIDTRARVEFDWDESKPADPAVHLSFALAPGGEVAETWLFTDVQRYAGRFPLRGGKGLNAMHLRHRNQQEMQSLFACGELVFQPSGDRVAVTEALGSTLELGGGITVEVRQRLSRAVRGAGDVFAESTTPGSTPNPAVELVFFKEGKPVSSATIEAKAKAPHKPTAAEGVDFGELTVAYEVGDPNFLQTGGLPQSSVALVTRDDAPDDLLVAVTDDRGVTTVGPYVAGSTIPLPWLQRGQSTPAVIFRDYARIAVQVQEVYCPSYATGRIGLKIRLSGDGDRDVERWVVEEGMQNDEPVPTIIERPSGPLKITYGQDRRPLGFDIRLEDFVLDTYEGTKNPRSFESFVRLYPEHRSYKLLAPHVIPPVNGGASGDETVAIAMGGSDGLEPEDVLRIGTPRAFYYGIVHSITKDASGQARVEVENIGRPVPLKAGDQVPAGVSAQELYHIYMNHTLTHKGFKFFQSSYDPNTEKMSIFSVANDPGGDVVYLGYALTILGLVFIVYVKPILVRRISARRAAAGLMRREAAAAVDEAAGAADANADPPDGGPEAKSDAVG